MLKRLFLLPILAVLISCRQVPPPALEFSIHGGDITLVNGESKRLYIDEGNYELHYPGQTPDPVWTSSNTSVAVIENEILYAVGVGTSTIKATIDNKYTATALCTVTAAFPESFYIHPHEKTLGLNEELQMIWQIYPDYAVQDLTWTTSDSSIATVSADGLVMGLSAGTATITATTANNLTDECVVTVADRTPLAITLEKGHIDLNVEQKITVNFWVVPLHFDHSFEFTATSSNSNVAKVESRIIFTSGRGEVDIKGIAPGDATITLSLANGVNASFTVTVSHVLPESITFDVGRVSILKGRNYTIDYTILPEDTTEKSLTWSSDDPSVATVSEDGRITGNEVGITTVRATAVNDVTQEVTVNVYAGKNDYKQPESEPNDTLQTAQLITNLGSTIVGKNANLADKDYYRIITVAGEQIFIDFRADRDYYSEHFSVKILNSEGDLEAALPLIEEGSPTSRRLIHYAVPDGGTYYIEVTLNDTAPITENNGYHLYVYTF
ncbi:MAG TPA: Ig-like domain-containing protein [Bacilli bacterium]|nr:Ig-like domain-containing protein [Bacilli bacterium]